MRARACEAKAALKHSSKRDRKKRYENSGCSSRESSTGLWPSEYCKRNQFSCSPPSSMYPLQCPFNPKNTTTTRPPSNSHNRHPAAPKHMTSAQLTYTYPHHAHSAARRDRRPGGLGRKACVRLTHRKPPGGHGYAGMPVARAPWRNAGNAVGKGRINWPCRLWVREDDTEPRERLRTCDDLNFRTELL